MPVYNEDILDHAAKLQRGLSEVISSVRFLHAHGNRLIAAEKQAEVDKVKSLAKPYGVNLTTWDGSNRPTGV